MWRLSIGTLGEVAEGRHMGFSDLSDRRVSRWCAIATSTGMFRLIRRLRTDKS